MRIPEVPIEEARKLPEGNRLRWGIEVDMGDGVVRENLESDEKHRGRSPFDER